MWRQGSQVSMRGASRSESFLSSHGRGFGPQEALKKGSRGLSRVATGNLGIPQLVLVTSGSFSGCLGEVRGTVALGWASQNSSGFAAMKESSSRVDTGTLVFLSISNSNRRVPGGLGEESQAWSCVEEWNSACLSSCSRGDRSLFELYVVFPNDA